MSGAKRKRINPESEPVIRNPSPLLGLLALLVRLKSGTPALFRQERPGLHGKPFTLLKFRTMTMGGGSVVREVGDGETAVGRLARVVK
jgi:sugar transferase EpsL